MYRYAIILVCLYFSSCQGDDIVVLDDHILEDYIALNSELESDFLIACAAGKEGGMHGIPEESTAIYFYPIEGATDYRYYETENIADSLNFEKYKRVDLSIDPVFNGYLQRWNRHDFDGERMAIVTYQSEGKLHISDPIRMKTNPKPSEVNPDLVEIEVEPSKVHFEWQDGIINENVIYFQVVADGMGNFVSGTYTYDRSYTFYDTSNVVLNITTDPNPTLISGNEYSFTMMAVSEDNWVNLLIQQTFTAQ